MSGVDLNSVINLIMQNPELLSEIKRLAENSAEKSEDAASTEVAGEPDGTPTEPEAAAEVPVEEPIKSTHSGVRRSELLHALSPYMSAGRQKAIETFMTIADILEMMRTK